jgi:hypothetical protein
MVVSFPSAINADAAFLTFEILISFGIDSPLVHHFVRALTFACLPQAGI